MIPIQDRNVSLTPEDLRQRYNLEEVNQLKNDFQGTQNNLKIVDKELQDFKKATIEQIEELIDQVDGKITTWFLTGLPTLENEPAINWDTDKLKEEHLNDLYFDKNTGYVYYFTKIDGIYKWERNTDQDVTTAMSTANAAKDTADGKRRVFIDVPDTPYDLGDLWTKSTGELKSCKVAKLEGQSFNETDWEDAMTKLQGEVFTSTGNKVITDTGVFTNLQFTSKDFSRCGHIYMAMLEEFRKLPIEISVMIPNNFTITEAKVILYHSPIRWINNYPAASGWGYARNLKLYKDSAANYYPIAYVNGPQLPPTTNSTEIVGAFGANGYTPSVPNDTNHALETATSIDIKSHLGAGLNLLRIQPNNSQGEEGGVQPEVTEQKYSGFCYAIINIFGNQR